METKQITIPLCAEHLGFYAATVTVDWICPICGGPRGEIEKGYSYDGNLRLYVDTWRNPCGHIDKYENVLKEAKERIAKQRRLEGEESD